MVATSGTNSLCINCALIDETNEVKVEFAAPLTGMVVSSHTVRRGAILKDTVDAARLSRRYRYSFSWYL